MIKRTKVLLMTSPKYAKVSFMKPSSRPMKKGEMLSSTMLVILTLIFLGIVVLLISLGKGSAPVADFFRNLIDFGANKSEIDYTPENEFIVYDEFGSLYPVIRVSYNKRVSLGAGFIEVVPELLFRWDRNLQKVEMILNPINEEKIKKFSLSYSEGVKYNINKAYRNGGWVNVLNPKTIKDFKNDKFKFIIDLILRSKSEEEMFEKIAYASQAKEVNIDFPIIRPNYDCKQTNDEKDCNVYGGEFVIIDPVARKEYELISVSEIKQILLELPEYYIFHSEDPVIENNPYPPLNRTLAYIDILKYYIKNNYNTGTCKSYDDITYFTISEKKFDSPLTGQWVTNFKFEWNQAPSVQYDIKDKVTYVRIKNSFYIKFLCDVDSSLGVSGFDNYDNIKKYLNLKQKLRNGEPYP